MRSFIWRQGETPSQWKIDLIIRIPKRKNLPSAQIRELGLTLQSTVSKLLSSIILERLKFSVPGKEIETDTNNFGLMRGHAWNKLIK